MSEYAAVERALERVRANPADERAWEEFYVHIRPQVAAFLYRRGARESVKDLTQEVFYRFLRYSPWRHDWSTLPGHTILAAYLRKTAISVIVSGVRDAAHQAPEQVVDDLDQLQDLAITAATVDGLLERLLGDLSDQEAALLRALVRGASLEQIATEYGIDYSAAGVRVHRLKKRVKAWLARYS